MRLSLRNKKRQDLLLTGFNVRAALFFFFNLSYLTLFLFWRWCNTWSHAGFANAKDTSEAFLLADMLYCAWKLLIRRHTRTRLFFFPHCSVTVLFSQWATPRSRVDFDCRLGIPEKTALRHCWDENPHHQRESLRRVSNAVWAAEKNDALITSASFIFSLCVFHLCFAELTAYSKTRVYLPAIKMRHDKKLDSEKTRISNYCFFFSLKATE